jgi:hypothetical protein
VGSCQYFTGKGVRSGAGGLGFATTKASSIRSPVDVALDGARLGPGVDCALDAGHGGIPCVVDFTGLELDLDYLPALYFYRIALGGNFL